MLYLSHLSDLYMNQMFYTSYWRLINADIESSFIMKLRSKKSTRVSMTTRLISGMFSCKYQTMCFQPKGLKLLNGSRSGGNPAIGIYGRSFNTRKQDIKIRYVFLSARCIACVWLSNFTSNFLLREVAIKMRTIEVRVVSRDPVGIRWTRTEN